MELEAVCRYNLPIVTVILNNSGVYRGDDASTTSTTRHRQRCEARHEYMIKAFGGKGYQATTPAEVAAALREALASGRPALIDCVIDPSDGTESGNIAHLNPKGITAKH